jgi:hypothetical protein
MEAVQPLAERQPGPRDSYPPGMVAIPCNDLARYHMFTHDLTLLDLPNGTEISMQRSASIVQNLNESVRALLASDVAWLWVIGDDHGFARDTVLRLLAHDVDIVAPLVCRRGPPFSLLAFDEESGVDELGRTLYHAIQPDELPPHGLLPVAAAGSAGMLIKREVFEALEEPWFENSDGYTQNEDVEFCRKARAAGYEVHIDVDTRIGHIGLVLIRPDRRGDQWGVTFDFAASQRNDIFIAGGVRPGDQGAPDTRTGILGW